VKRTIRIAISIAISVLFLGFAVSGVNWTEAVAALAHAQYLYTLPMFPITVWTLYIRAQRWRLLLRPLGTPAMRTLVAATNIGFMANMVLPLRAGEVIRPVLLSRKEGQPIGGVLATIVLERIFDMFMVLLLFGLSMLTVSTGENDTAMLRQWGYSMSAVALLIAAAVVLIRWQEALALRLLTLVLRALPPALAESIDRFFHGFVKALEILDSPGAFLRVLAWSVYLWVVIASIYFWGFLAFDLPVPFVTGSIVVTALIALAVAAPSAPGYIGVFQAGCILALGFFGVSKSDAIAYSIILHITQFAGTVAAGLYSLTREGMSLRQIEHVSEADGATA